jgi:hypothetical protein
MVFYLRFPQERPNDVYLKRILPSISGSDQGGCKSDSDECSFFGLADACTWGLNKDIAE